MSTQQRSCYELCSTLCSFVCVTTCSTSNLSVKSCSSLPLQPFSDTSDLLCSFPILSFPPFVFPLFQIHSPLTLPLIHPNSVLPLSSLNLCFSLNSKSILPWSPLLSEPLVFKPCVSFDTNQSDYCIICIIALFAVFSSYPLFLSDSALTFVQPLSDLCLTSVPLLSNSDLWWPPWNYRTYLLIIWVGVTPKLKPSPTHYPLPIICLTLLWSNSEHWFQSSSGIDS